MPFLLPLATILTAALTYETLTGTKRVIQKRVRRRKQRDES